MSKKPAKNAPRPAQTPKRQTTPQMAAKRPKPSSGPETAERIALALETIAAHLAAASPSSDGGEALHHADAFIWHPDGRLAPVPHVSRVDIGLLKGIDRMRDILIENTERFANGFPANNALLWGARGMGKSSLVKAAHASINLNRKTG
jgi:predicted AAA+ superfamily ATPase